MQQRSPEDPKADNKDWLTGHDESGSAQPPTGDPLSANSGDMQRVSNVSSTRRGNCLMMKQVVSKYFEPFQAKSIFLSCDS